MVREVVDAAYASDLEAVMLAGKPDLSVHGHVHVAHDYQITVTRVRKQSEEVYFAAEPEDSQPRSDLIRALTFGHRRFVLNIGLRPENRSEA